MPDYRPAPGGASPAPCLDCGGIRLCAPTCPTARRFNEDLDADLERLAARDGEPFVRPIAAVEREFCGACGLPIPRRDRRRFAVRVHPAGRGGVRREILLDGRATGVELDAGAVPAGSW